MQWAPCSENAFGAFIHVTVQEGLRQGMSQCGFQLAVSWAIQGIYGYELLLALPLPLGSSASGFCTSVSCTCVSASVAPWSVGGAEMARLGLVRARGASLALTGCAW